MPGTRERINVSFLFLFPHISIYFPFATLLRLYFNFFFEKNDAGSPRTAAIQTTSILFYDLHQDPHLLSLPS